MERSMCESEIDLSWRQRDTGKWHGVLVHRQMGERCQARSEPELRAALDSLIGSCRPAANDIPLYES
jgi:hypothetical protein